jgi:ABC-type Na+ efflux pump permease subunit
VSAHPRRRVASALEIVASCALYFGALWWVGPSIQHRPASGASLGFVALVALGAVHVLWLSPIVIHGDPPELRGWGVPASWAGSRERVVALCRPYIVLTAVGAAVLLGVALARDPAIFHRVVWRSVAVKFLLYVPFAFVQAMFVFGFLMTRLRDVFEGRGQVALATAVVFSALHAPNAPLMAAVFVAGLAWAWSFHARPSIALLAVSHAILGTILHRFVELHMRIGPFYGHPEAHFTRALVPGVEALIGNLY